jgi:hypothetical protein
LYQQSATPTPRKRRDPISPADIPELMVNFALTARQAAVVENTSITTMWERIKRGEYRTVKDGGSRRVLVASILERRQRLLNAACASITAPGLPEEMQR